MKAKEIKINKTKSGFVMLYAIVLSSMLVSVTLGVMNISFKEIGFGTSGIDTNDAFFAADTGVECALYNDKITMNKFPVTGPATGINCAGVNILPVFSSGVYNFVVPEFGNEGENCVKVTVDKSIPPTVSITSKGYNVGDLLCDSSVPNYVERELKVIVNGSGVGLPPPPVIPPSSYSLTVASSGSGSGVITSNPTGIACGSTCQSNFTDGSSITLSVAPNSGSVFNGWSGGCSGSGVCNLTMNADMSVTASFSAIPTSQISFVAANSAGLDTVSVPLHQSGDLLIMFAYRDGNSVTPPQIPSGWTSVGTTNGADNNSSRMAYIVDDSNNIGDVTSTNATEMIVQIYRGQHPIDPIGADGHIWGIGTIVTYPGITLNNTDGASWVVGFSGHRSGSATVDIPPTGMTHRKLASGVGSAGGHDSY